MTPAQDVLGQASAAESARQELGGGSSLLAEIDKARGSPNPPPLNPRAGLVAVL